MLGDHKVNTAHVDLIEYMDLVKFKEELLENNSVVVETYSNSHYQNKTTVYYTMNETVKRLTDKLNESLGNNRKLEGELRCKEFEISSYKEAEKYHCEISTLPFWEFVGIKWEAFKKRFKK